MLLHNGHCYIFLSVFQVSACGSFVGCSPVETVQVSRGKSTIIQYKEFFLISRVWLVALLENWTLQFSYFSSTIRSFVMCVCVFTELDLRMCLLCMCVFRSKRKVGRTHNELIYGYMVYVGTCACLAAQQHFRRWLCMRTRSQTRNYQSI